MLHFSSNASEVFASVRESLNTFLQEAAAEAAAAHYEQHRHTVATRSTATSAGLPDMM
jgi:hypothetical protein